MYSIAHSPPVDGPKDPWSHVLSLPERFVGDPASLARDNIPVIRSMSPACRCVRHIFTERPLKPGT